MPSKPRKVKSHLSLQHEDNRILPWDDDTSRASNLERTSVSNSADETICRLENGITLRRLRRSDAKQVHGFLNDTRITKGYPDTSYPQPYSLWRAYDLIDSKLNRKKWRRLNPQTAAGQSTYDAAVQAFTDMNVDVRLSKLDDTGRSAQNIGPQACGQSGEKADIDNALVPRAYAIAKDDVLIGWIEIHMSDDVDPDGDDPEETTDPAFLHSTELCYWLSPEHWGKGIMTTLVREFCEWIWKSFAHVEIIGACVYMPGNPGSIRVLEKVGFVSEWSSRGGVRKNGQLQDLDQLAFYRPGGLVEKSLAARPQPERPVFRLGHREKVTGQ
ncbi:GNAT domain-containing protein [Xylariaceae sp. FL1019]|nr:GNAT domain-containing protein [Xylariaceae sp. FL1019]